jgi:signal transduction histidine kinase
MPSKFARRLGSLSSWQPWTVFWILFLRLVFALTTDPSRTENYSPLWFVIWLITSTLMVAFVLLVMALGLRKRLLRKPSPWANIATVATAGVLGNIATGLLAISWGLDHEGIWTLRITAAALSHTSVFVLSAAMRASTIERNEKVRQLLVVEQRLQGYRESAKQIANDELERLRQQSVEALVPHIDSIEVLISARFERDLRDDLLSELSTMITDEVRPLTQSLAEEADRLTTIEIPDVDPKLARPRWKSRFILRDSISPLAQGGLMILIFAMFEFLMVAHNSALRGALGGLGVMLLFAIIKALLPRTREVSPLPGVIYLTLIGAISTAPSWYIMWFEYGWDERIFPTGISQIAVNVAALFLISYINANDLASKRYLRNLEIANAQLAKEVALFEQKLALNRKDWGKRIHGDVQAALAAALTRLRRSPKPEPYEFELVKQDLARARQALSQHTDNATTFEDAVDTLTSAWSAVCQITVNVSARAKRALDASQDARTCVNEICKEAISNAVRHGDAKHATINLERHQDDLIVLEVVNDGSPVPREIKQGLGTGMIDDLTLSWSLESKQSKTTLKAVIPVQTN